MKLSNRLFLTSAVSLVIACTIHEDGNFPNIRDIFSIVLVLFSSACAVVGFAFALDKK